MRRLTILVAALVLLMPSVALGAAIGDGSEYDDSVVYTLVDEAGREVTQRAGRVFEGDEYISGDDQLYRVTRVDDAAARATAQNVGPEPAVTADEAQMVFEMLSSGTAAPSAGPTGTGTADGKRLIAMYCTHSDESYVPGDGTSSKTKGAGIYDVGEALKKNLESLGVKVELDKTTHLPHDAKAYSRSRRTAEELLKSGPSALLDVHRDALPASHYDTDVNGEEVTKVRLLVGRSNPSSSANRSFAKQLKAAADKKYPGLIKDIFIGKGDYNQELYPKSVLLEFGTHESEKDQVIDSTKYMANVINDVVFGGGTAQAAPAGESTENRRQDNRGGATGIIWVVVIAAIAAGAYALISTGTFRRMGDKLARGTSEVTGGLFGKKPKDGK
ncbi:MAG: hypothetical protein GX558_02025 [Clostridiales bacterium]|nr:hypothetical protein [Clostridiales bacterium]